MWIFRGDFLRSRARVRGSYPKSMSWRANDQFQKFVTFQNLVRGLIFFKVTYCCPLRDASFGPIHRSEYINNIHSSTVCQVYSTDMHIVLKTVERFERFRFETMFEIGESFCLSSLGG